jgi:NAD(P)-dependent dehydrogenase (short-subunit alcohol dehydrogenase family)
MTVITMKASCFSPVYLAGAKPEYEKSVFDDRMESRREQLRTTLPIRRVVGPADIAALAVHLMTNTAVTGATFDIDGGQQLVEG